MQVDPATSTGMPPAVVCGASGVQGAGTTGTQGIGVSTPSAAAVAAATVGFASDWHMPNGAIFAPGATSAMVATGRPSTIGRGRHHRQRRGGETELHMIMAPDTAHGLPIVVTIRGRHHRSPYAGGQFLAGGGDETDDARSPIPASRGPTAAGR